MCEGVLTDFKVSSLYSSNFCDCFRKGMRKNSNVFKTLHYWEPCDLVSDQHIGACPIGLHDVDLGSPAT